MKKLNYFIFFMVGAGILIICLIISRCLHSEFDIETDFLSASATFFAAAVAILLYRDWRAPHLLTKIETEQREIKAATRRLKKNADSFLFFMKTKTPAPTGLNNGDQFSLEYQKIINLLLDDLDDLYTLLISYECIFDEKISLEREHIKFINSHVDKLNSTYSFLSKYNFISEYADSFRHSSRYVESGDFEGSIRFILEDLPDGLSKLYTGLARK